LAVKVYVIGESSASVGNYEYWYIDHGAYKIDYF